MNKPNIFLGCVIAPLAAPLVMLALTMMSGEDLRGQTYEYGLGDYQEMFGIAIMFLVLGTPIAYIIMLCIGLPFYYLAKKLGYINFWSISFGSSFAAVLPLFLMWAEYVYVDHKKPEDVSFLFYLSFALCGYIVGVIFWYVSGLNNQSTHNKSVKQTG